jgi:ABC-2 type transport system permease protein
MGDLVGGAPGAAGAPAVEFEQFVFPGIIAMSVFFSAIFNAVSLVYDREFGILKEMLVAPVSRAAVAFGKTLGGATVATLQGTLIFVFAPLVGVRLSVPLVLQSWPIMFLGAFALASMGVAVAARMRSIESFQMVNQFVMFPMIFLSGIFFPLQGLPVWMDVLVRINPVSYAVDPLRRLVLQAQGLPDAVVAELSESGLALSVAGRDVGVALGITIVAAFGLVMNVLAMWLISIRD